MRDLLIEVFGEPASAQRRRSRAAREVWPAPPAAEPPLRPAAVLVPLVERADGMTVLLTRRTEAMRAHAGQISFPGGRLAPGDASPEDTALRETEEEIGVPARHVELIGRLGAHDTRTGFHVVPVVGLLRPPFPMTVDPGEVDHVFEVPLDFVLDPANLRLETRAHRGETRAYYVLAWRGYDVWGLTARVLFEFARTVRGS